MPLMKDESQNKIEKFSQDLVQSDEDINMSDSCSVEQTGAILHKIKRAMKEMMKNSLDWSRPEFTEHFISNFPHFHPYRTFINVIYSWLKEGLFQEQRGRMIKSENNNIILPSIMPLNDSLQDSWGFDVSKISTKRATPFGRTQIVSICNKEKNDLLFLVSDFELRILKSNHKLPQRFLLSWEEVVDSTYRYVFNISMYDASSKIFMPIGHWLMRYLKTEHFELILAWFQKEFGTFFKPSLFITDYTFEMYHSCHVLYENIPKYISLIDFIYKTWKNAYQTGILSEREVPNEYLKFLSDIPFLLISHNENSREQFENLVNKYLPVDKFDKFVKPYIQIFQDSPSWYNIYTMASTYKNIFLNAAKSQEIQKTLFVNSRGLSAIEITKNFESQSSSLHESIWTGGKQTQPGSMYRLVKSYFNKYRGKTIKPNELVNGMIKAMGDLGMRPGINEELNENIIDPIDELFEVPDIKKELKDDLFL